MKERPILFSAPMVRAILEGRKTQTRRVVKKSAEMDTNGFMALVPDEKKCPYGQAGDRLWVRETFHVCPHHDDVFYKSDDLLLPRKCMAHRRWRPSIHMPRWASRITLKITGVRVERLQDISEADAIAEGIEPDGDFWKHYGPHPLKDLGENVAHAYPVNSFRSLWHSINGPESWAANPWVWVVEFKCVTEGE
jgi:hypothetical protein